HQHRTKRRVVGDAGDVNDSGLIGSITRSLQSFAHSKPIADVASRSIESSIDLELVIASQMMRAAADTQRIDQADDIVLCERRSRNCRNDGQKTACRQMEREVSEPDSHCALSVH